jgi:hypothetical protein
MTQVERSQITQRVTADGRKVRLRLSASHRHTLFTTGAVVVSDLGQATDDDRSVVQITIQT